MTNLSDKILDKIQTEKIHPAGKPMVWFKRITIWLLAIAAVVVGALGAAVIIFVFANQDWDIYARFTNNRALFALFILPYFWVIILGVANGIGYFFFRHTKKGYRYSLFLLTTLYIILTFALGAVAYRMGIGNRLEDAVAHSVPNYNTIAPNRAIWTQPEHGLLAGEIVAIEANHITIEDLTQNKWVIDISSTTGNDLISIGADIKILGTMTNTNTFHADALRPWCGCGGCMQHKGQSCVEHCRMK